MKATTEGLISATMLAATLAFFSTPMLRAQAATSASDRARTVLTVPLPAHMKGDSLRATLITVQYGPGEASPPHTHGCPVIVYVLEGKVRSQIGGQQEIVYSAGDSFYEPPGGIHAVSANASHEKPARFLAFFICDRDAPLSSDPPSSASGAK